MKNLTEEYPVKVDKTKKKRIDGFGIMKNIPSFEEDKEEHPDLQ